MSRTIKAGDTDQSTVVRVVDSTDGTPETGVAYNTAGVDLWYRREGGLRVAITEVTLAAVDSAHSDGGFIHISDGYCRLDLPDAAVAAGADGVMVGGTFTGMVVIGAYHPLVAYDPQDTVRLGLTALPNAAADAAGGIPISDAGGLDLDAKLANTNEITAARMGALTDWINGGRLDLLLDAVKAVTDALPDSGALTTIGTDTARLTAARAQVLTDWIDAGRLDAILDAAATAAELAKVPKSDGTVSWNATAAAQIQTEANDALVAYDPPTRTEATADKDEILNILGAPNGGTLAIDIASIKSDTASILLDTGTDGVVVAAASKTGYTLSAAGLADFFDTNSGTTYSAAVAGSVVKEIADNSGGTTPPTAAAIADAVWDEATSGHATAGTFGKAVSDILEDTSTTIPTTLGTPADTDLATDIANLGQYEIEGAVGRNSSSAYFWRAKLKVNGSVVTSGLSSPTLVRVRGNNGDTDLTITETTAAALDTEHAMYGAFTLGTAPTDGTPFFVEITVVYGGTTYRGRIPGVSGSV